MRCWSFPRRVRANGYGGVVGGAGGGNNDDRYRLLGTVAALEAGLTLVELADDETTNVLLAIIKYDHDAIYDAIEVATCITARGETITSVIVKQVKRM